MQQVEDLLYQEANLETLTMGSLILTSHAPLSTENRAVLQHQVNPTTDSSSLVQGIYMHALQLVMSLQPF